jgi:hypothetical protein
MTFAKLVLFTLFSLVAVLLSIPSTGYADDDAIEEMKLREALESSGAKNVELSGCMIAFDRTFPSNEGSNGYFAFRKYINLSLLADLNDVSVIARTSGDVEYFAAYLELYDGYHIDLYQRLNAFTRWVREAYPDSGWPYGHPRSQDDLASRIEFEFNRRVDNIEELSRRVDFSSHGPITVLDTDVSFLSSPRAGELEAIVLAMTSYSEKNQCPSTNWSMF